MSDDLDFMPAPPAGGPDKAKSKPAVSSALVVTPAGSGSGGPGDPDGDRAPGERAELPTWNRSRRKRKATVEAEKQDDPFQRGVRQASRRVIDAPKLVIGAIVIVVASIAGGVALHNHRISADAEAARILQDATAAFVRGQVVSLEEQEEFGEQIRFHRDPLFATEEARETAINEALAAAKDSGRAKVELNAALVSAAKAMHDGDFEAAIAEYDAFLAEADDDHPLRYLALEGKGNALEATGDLEGALELFATIAPHPTDIYRHMALYHQGRVLEALDRDDEALAIYQQYFEEFPASRPEMATPMVRERLEVLDPDHAARLAAPPSSPFPTL